MSTKRKYEEFFDYEDGNSARCKRGGCSRPVVSRTQTTSLEKHVKVHHPDDYSRFMELKSGSTSKANEPKDDGNAADAPKPAGKSVVMVDRSVSPMPQDSQRLVIESDDEAEASSAPRRLRRVILESDDENEDEPPRAPTPAAARARTRARPPMSARRTHSLAEVAGGPAALDNGEYLVERVEAMRRDGDRIFWWVKWVGWDAEYSGWEPHDHLENARDAISDYLYELYGFFAPTVPWLLQLN